MLSAPKSSFPFVFPLQADARCRFIVHSSAHPTSSFNNFRSCCRPTVVVVGHRADSGRPSSSPHPRRSIPALDFSPPPESPLSRASNPSRKLSSKSRSRQRPFPVEGAVPLAEGETAPVPGAEAKPGAAPAGDAKGAPAPAAGGKGVAAAKGAAPAAGKPGAPAAGKPAAAAPAAKPAGKAGGFPKK